MQSRGDGPKRNKIAQFPESTKTLRGHDLLLGSLLFLNKSAPSPRFRVNLYLDYNIYTGRLNIPDQIDKVLVKLDSMLMGRETNTKIEVLETDIDID